MIRLGFGGKWFACILDCGLEEQGSLIGNREQNKNMEKTIEEVYNHPGGEDNNGEAASTTKRGMR